MEEIYKIAEPFFNDECKTVFVTTDGNVFYDVEFAKYHATKSDGKFYTVDKKGEKSISETEEDEVNQDFKSTKKNK